MQAVGETLFDHRRRSPCRDLESRRVRRDYGGYDRREVGRGIHQVRILIKRTGK